jgi:hypothetical protein
MAADAAPGTGVEGASPTAPDTTARQHDAPLMCAWRCGGTALPAAPTATTGASSTPLRRPGDTDMRWRRTRRPSPTPRPCSRYQGRHAAPRQARGRQRGPAHDTRYAADGAWGHHERPRMQDGAHAAPASVHGTIGRHGSQYDDGLGPRLPWGLRRAGVAAMLQGTRCVWHAAVVPGLLCPGPRQKARLRSSNPTLRLRRGRQRERGTSGRCVPSPAAGCSALT